MKFYCYIYPTSFMAACKNTLVTYIFRKMSSVIFHKDALHILLANPAVLLTEYLGIKHIRFFAYQYNNTEVLFC